LASALPQCPVTAAIACILMVSHVLVALTRIHPKDLSFSFVAFEEHHTECLSQFYQNYQHSIKM
jgi:hypothetical protein